jgi:hypothetical protein
MQILQLSITHEKPFSSTVYTELNFPLFSTTTEPLQLPNHNPNRTWSLYKTQTRAYMHSPNSQPTHAHNSYFSLPKQTRHSYTLFLWIHTGPATPLTHNPNKSPQTPQIHNPHKSTQPLLFLAQTDPNTPFYSCESTQSLQLPLFTTQT